jgi:hypothetical protein
VTTDLYGHPFDHSSWATAIPDRKAEAPGEARGPLAWGFGLSRLSESNRRPIHYE